MKPVCVLLILLLCISFYTPVVAETNITPFQQGLIDKHKELKDVSSSNTRIQTKMINGEAWVVQTFEKNGETFTLCAHPTEETNLVNGILSGKYLIKIFKDNIEKYSVYADIANKANEIESTVTIAADLGSGRVGEFQHKISFELKKETIGTANYEITYAKIYLNEFEFELLATASSWIIAALASFLINIVCPGMGIFGGLAVGAAVDYCWDEYRKDHTCPETGDVLFEIPIRHKYISGGPGINQNLAAELNNKNSYWTSRDVYQTWGKQKTTIHLGFMCKGNPNA